MTQEEIMNELERWWRVKFAGTHKSYTFGGGFTGHYMTNKTIIEMCKHFADLHEKTKDKEDNQ